MVRVFLASSLSLALAHALNTTAPPVHATVTADLDDAAVLKQFQAWQASPAGQFARKQGLLESADVGPDPARLAAFKETLLTVAELNQMHTSATFSANNPFAAMTNAEFAAYIKRTGADVQAKTDPARLEISTATDSVDWTSSGCVAPVKSQGVCGSCYAHAAVAAVESAMCLLSNPRKLVTYSDQQLTSCGPGGCTGGISLRSFNWMFANGVCTQDAYPYTNQFTSVTQTCETTCSPVKIPFKVLGNLVGEKELEANLRRQPIATTMAASSAVFRNYESGIITTGCDTEINHMVLAVGYGTDAGLPYFKFKNSWGTSWGEQGYVRLQRGVGGVGTCGLATSGDFPQITPPTFGLVTARGGAIYEYYGNVFVGAASNSANEQWRYDATTHQLIVSSNQQCLDAYKDSASGQFRVHTYACDASNGNQAWTIDGARQRIKHRTHPNLCLDVDPTQNNKVQVWSCYDNAPNQRVAITEEKVKLHTFNGRYLVSGRGMPQFVSLWGAPFEWVVSNVDMTWRARSDGGGDKCLDAYEPWNGGTVHMWPCDADNANQKWRFDAATGQLRHATHTGFCLDMATTTGAKPHLWTCNSPANDLQKFTYESLSFPQ
ncbi:hypothetical protein SPRG_01736 [Saprolegnia parasitica CBS 223.65]|uniref:Uncharacterized protein n=1 Tax=Saprolegnia parasitica (strain CBS 223.65) TaxID=695850 RepID=A0A067D4A9_SAPPC|nr:hypothetical protein SPRG_01736 [Saprolegnia parasitica CBS 223.65]KDO33857.1 hypothetical protein SPRG_01736 [Saprolegnia parasitica CBS 223.65]|eukprot:XP_012195493.1 hypothetical protein SPRG_01736 [Saprolegnia parasitica CBS 223.65]